MLKAKRLNIFTDSELVYKQVTGQYKVKNEKLKILCLQAQELIKIFDHVNIEHVLRDKNKEADQLATSSLK